MDLFQYTLMLETIDTLKTKTAVEALKRKLATNVSDFYTFKALTYLLKTHSNKTAVGAPLSAILSKHILRMYKAKKHTLAEITEHCNTPIVLSNVHFTQFITSRYMPYQALAHALNTIQIKES